MATVAHYPASFLSHFWLPVWFRFAIVGFFALMAGFVVGERAGYLTAIAGLVILIGFHLYYLKKVTLWLNRAEAGEATDAPHEELPVGFGAWETVFIELRRARKREDKRTERVAETLNRFIEASSALPDGIIILDRADRIEWCNPSACIHFGLDLERDRTYLIANLVRQPAFTEYLVRADFREPLQIMDPANTLALAVQFLPFQETRRIILSRDVTRFVRIEAMRRDFIANVSHELRTPLTVVGGFLEQLDEQPDVAPEQRLRIHAMMLDQTRRMQRLVQDLLSLSRLERQAAPSMEEETPAKSLIEAAVAEARALSAGRHTIEVNVDDTTRLRGAAEELRSAFGNLLTNAVRYTPAGGTVSVTLMIDDQGATFSIADTGPGIAPEHLPRLTERFYRIDKSRSRETGGTGLGLAIVKHVLARHGGRLEIESELGKGSTFHAILPAARVVPPSNSVSATA